jgi:hypothetical protein
VTGATAAAAGKGSSAARTGTATKAKGSTKSGQADKSGAATKSDIKAMKAQAAQTDMLLEGAYEAGRAGTSWDQVGANVRDAPGAREAYDFGLEELAEDRRGAPADDGEATGASAPKGRSASSRIRSAGGDASTGVGKVAALRGPGLANDGAGFVLGLVLYALVLNYLQGGAGQVRGWMKAKFLNQPWGGAAPAGGGDAGAAVGAAGKKAAKKAAEG